jgi:hypothetical protein
MHRRGCGSSRQARGIGRFTLRGTIEHFERKGRAAAGGAPSGFGPFSNINWGLTGMSEPTKEELMARIAELESQAGGRKRGTLEFRVGEKGGVSVYGLGRFPVTLYYEQWIRLLDAVDSLRSFLEENKSKLKLKPKE